MLESFTVDTFSPCLGQTFRVDVGAEAPFELELIEARELSDRYYRGSEKRTPFYIVFRGPRDAMLPQRTYRMEHDEIGTFDLFLVPVGADETGLRYQADFN